MKKIYFRKARLEDLLEYEMLLKKELLFGRDNNKVDEIEDLIKNGGHLELKYRKADEDK